MTAFSVFKTLACLAKDRVPGQLFIQITNQCNARCPQCGMRKTAGISTAGPHPNPPVWHCLRPRVDNTAPSESMGPAGSQIMHNRFNIFNEYYPPMVVLLKDSLKQN